ncbi:protein kinase-like protein [Trypanosoma conorhini]|uniref:Protein kinase-like protein n=1 Tax=Trypanosoma conorhini TaxID=83891 RepID=A0A3R7PIT6_9TRYP|nr:protein kinase-like protein [Trypanosoma conorhini]RNF25930.1 protein kinase-like protein [Trypanosoma conorhini]
MAGQHCFCSHARPGIGALAVLLLFLVLHASGAAVRFGGSVYRGLAEEELRLGGSTLTIRAAFPAFNGYDEATLKKLLTEMLSVSHVMSEGGTKRETQAGSNSWQRQLPRLMERSQVEVEDNGGTVRLTFHPLSDSVVNEPLLVVPCLPRNLAQKRSVLVEGTEGKCCHLGNAFVITPKTLIRIDTDRLAQMGGAEYITGNTIEIPLIKENSAGVGPKLKVMEGNACANTVEASTSESEWDEEKQVFRFLATRGGLVTLCYMPFPENLPDVMLKVGETLKIAGPEGVSTEPLRLRSGAEFKGHVFGTNLSERDELVITAQLCSDFTPEKTLLPEFSLSSSSRALFFGVLSKEGLYHVCYCSAGSERYVRVATLLVEKDVDAATNKKATDLPLDRVDNPHPASSTGLLQINQTIMLFLRHETLNVSSLVWSGGRIVGPGEINCFGASTITSHGDEPRTLSFILRNYGDMAMDLPQLVLKGGGAVHNYGRLTITVAHMGEAGGAGIRSRSRSNVIINRGGIIHVIAAEQGPAVLCQAHIMNMKGTLVLSGSLKIAELLVGERAKLVLKRGARVSVSATRLSGRITLLENSELALTGDSSLVSVNVKGNQSRILFTGPSLSLDSIIVTGEVITDIIGPSSGSSIVMVALYGVIAFGEGSHLNLRRTRLTTNMGLAQLVIAGALTADIDSVVFSGKIWIQVNNVAIMYGYGKGYRVNEGGETSFVSLAVAENATLVALYVESSPDPRVNCDTALSFLDRLKVEGRFLLRGCVTVPLGGAIRGSVEYLKLSEEVPTLMPLLLAANIRLPLDALPSRRASLVLGGETLLRIGAKLDVGEIVMKNAVLGIEGAVYVGAEAALSVDRGSRLVLERGCVINATAVHVEGLLEADMLPGPLITGSLEIASGGQVKLYSVRGPPCVDVLSAGGGVRWAGDSSVECYSYPLLPVSEYSSRSLERKKYNELRRKWFALPPNMECPEEYLREEANRLFLPFFHFYMNLYEPLLGVPSTHDMIVWGITFIFLGFMVVQVFLQVHGMTWKQWLVDLGREPPLRLTLSRSEFALHGMNYVVLATLLFSALQTSMLAILPQTPLPVGFMSVLRFRSVMLMLPHRLLNAHVTMRRAMTSIFIWGFAAVALMLLNTKRIRLSRCGKWVQVIVHILSRVEKVLQLFLVVFSFPIRSLVLDSFACNTFLSEIPTCADAHDRNIMPIISLLLLYFVMPSGRFSAMQLLHCDLQCRRSVLVALHALSLTESAMWKVLSNSPLLLLVNNFTFRCLRLLFLLHAPPTAYININRLIVEFSRAALFAHFCVLFHTIRVYLGFAKTCRDGEIYFVVVAFLWFVMLGVNVCYNIIAVPGKFATTNNVAIDAIERSIQQIHSRIQDLQYEFLTCASMEERENVLNATSRLNMELVEKQERYRREKYCILGSFYFPGLHAELTPQGMTSAEEKAMHSEELEMGALLASRLSSASPAAAASLMSAAEAKQDVQDPLTQEEMESFRCGPVLGSGSYGSVHLGILATGRLVAVKYVSIQNSSKRALSQVETEVNMLKELSHPNIIRYLGCRTNHDNVLVFMEFAVAGNLTSVVRSFTGLNESVIRYYTYQMLLGLRYLHQKGVVHRDVKGENILVDGLGVVKLADFGSSKNLLGINDYSRAGCDTLVGSPYWMAPEVIRNEEYGTKADIWSVGCTVVELLNGGTPPWRKEFENVVSMLYLVGNTDVMLTIPEGTSELCRDFLKKCLERDITKRPSAEELLQHPWLGSAEKDTAQPSNEFPSGHVHLGDSCAACSTATSPGGKGQRRRLPESDKTKK